jgi:glucan phosphoethanolaminetransferase (alkaline phosphatase superfamily)
MRYAFYIRAFLLVYQFMVLTSVDEIYESNLGSTSEVTSLALALFILVVCLLFMLYSLILIISESTLLNKDQPLEELYLGN